MGRNRLDRALSHLADAYSEFARRRQALENAQQLAMQTHVKQCRPIDAADLPCREQFRKAMDRYHQLREPPTCIVGASLPLLTQAILPTPLADAPGLQAALAASATARTRGGCLSDAVI